MDAAHILARAAASGSFAGASDGVRAAYRNFILDTVAVMAAGAAHPSLSPAREAFVRADGGGVSTALGMRDGVSAATAALVNGAAMTVLQLQDGHRRARGHPMSHVLPVALSIAEERKAGTAEFLDAIMAGYEVSARVGAALGGMQPLLHDTGTFGAIGAAVAAAYLLADSPGEREALIAASIDNAAAVALFPFRDTCMEGSGVHHLFVGMGAQNGLQAARAAHAGLAPSPATLERFFGPRAGENFTPEMLTDGIGMDGRWSGFEIERAYLKWHPVCAHLGPMLDCIEILRERLGGFRPDEIAGVDVEVYATALQYDAQEPQSDLAARFSFRTVAALALTSEGLAHDSFYRDNFTRDEVQAMAARVTLRASGDLDALYPAQRPARVTIKLADGQGETAEVLFPKGDGPNALSGEDVDAKARRLLAPVWADDGANAIIRLLDTIAHGTAADLPQELGRLLRRAI
jgi:2-methylcitrate dehydratase PrpD